MKDIVRILVLAILTMIFTGCSPNKDHKNAVENRNVPIINSYIDLGAETAIVTDIF